MHIRHSLRFSPMALAALLSFSAAAMTPTPGNTDQAAITIQLHRYEQALNSADINTVMQLYAKDAVFMPQHSLPAVGRDAVFAAYQHVFAAIQLNINFSIDEIVVMTDDWAYARTRSNGTVKVLNAATPPAPEANQELFLLHREADGKWRFARYIFSTTNPPKMP